eukprot:scaffold869_cov105-Isochrysis_galbana.AAC.10
MAGSGHEVELAAGSIGCDGLQRMISRKPGCGVAPLGSRRRHSTRMSLYAKQRRNIAPSLQARPFPHPPALPMFVSQQGPQLRQLGKSQLETRPRYAPTCADSASTRSGCSTSCSSNRRFVSAPPRRGGHGGGAPSGAVRFSLEVDEEEEAPAVHADEAPLPRHIRGWAARGGIRDKPGPKTPPASSSVGGRPTGASRRARPRSSSARTRAVTAAAAASCGGTARRRRARLGRRSTPSPASAAKLPPLSMLSSELEPSV